MGNKKSGNPVDTAAKIAPLDNKAYEKALRKLHVELVKLQRWVVHKGLKVCIVFEGRDGAGKGGTIKAITERVSPRIFRVVALPSPTEREKSQLYFQRYIKHLPAAGEIVIFDRSWYNRAGVERVMGFVRRRRCRSSSTARRWWSAAWSNRALFCSSTGWRSLRRSRSAVCGIASTTGVKSGSSRRWTLSLSTAGMNIPLPATPCSPPPIPPGRRGSSPARRIKKRVRLNIITHLLSQIPYEALPVEPVTLPKRKIGKMKQTNFPFRFIPEKF